MQFTTAAAALVLAAVSVSADLKINNWCSEDVYILQSTDGSADYNPQTGGPEPIVLAGSNGAGNILDMQWNTSTSGTSVKIGKNNVLPFVDILQLEYTLNSELWFDLSDLDGSGDGLTGTPFAADNVKVSPTGSGANTYPCSQVNCVANAVCTMAYQSSGDLDTLVCPSDTGDMWLDLCEPTAGFNSRKRSSHADKHLRRHLTAIY